MCFGPACHPAAMAAGASGRTLHGLKAASCSWTWSRLRKSGLIEKQPPTTYPSQAKTLGNILFERKSDFKKKATKICDWFCVRCSAVPGLQQKIVGMIDPVGISAKTQPAGSRTRSEL